MKTFPNKDEERINDNNKKKNESKDNEKFKKNGQCLGQCNLCLYCC